MNGPAPADPRVEALGPIFATFGFDAPSIEEVRRRFHATAAAFPEPEGVTIDHTEVAGMAATRIRPSDRTPVGRILHLHGGGYVIGSVEVQLGVPGRLAWATGCEVVSVGYRTAPEHPLPAATEDGVTAYRALAEEGPVAAISGDSAGGALAVLVAVALRDQGVEGPGSLVALSPWTDLAGAGVRHRDPGFTDPVVPRSFLALAAAAARGDRPPDDPAVTPVAADVAGLPPTMIQVGGAEVVLDDAGELAAHLARAGVEVALHVWPAMVHVFVAYPPLAPESDDALAEVAAFVARHAR